jgi:hypothetical protein
METFETIMVSNHGNSAGKFVWDSDSSKVFSVHPSRGEVPARSDV